MQRLAPVPSERVMLRIDPAKKAAFLEMLKLFDFVEVETLNTQLNRYIENAPQNVPLTDEDIVAEVKASQKRNKRV
jgi:hypothetical protein